MLNTTISVEKFLETLVSISRFNNGEAMTILKEVKKSADGMKIIFEDNEPSCVIMTWDKYKEMLEEIEDQYLLGIVDEREKNGSGETISFEEILAERGLTVEDIDRMLEEEDVELE